MRSVEILLCIWGVEKGVDGNNSLNNVSRTKADRFCGKFADVPNNVVTSLLMIVCGRDLGL